MFSPRRLSSHFLFIFFLLVSVSVNGAPLGSQHAVREVVKRQAYSGPQTVQQVTTSQTPQGEIVTTCQVTLTPTKDANGQDQVVEVRQCTVALVGSSAVSTDTSSATSTSVSAVTTASTTSTTDSTTATSTTASTDSAVTTASTTPTSSPAAISVNSVTSVSASTPSSSDSPTTTSATTSPTNTAAAASDDSSSTDTTGTSTPTDVGATSSGTAAADTSASTTPFAIPGKKLQVLPIGLGVFAGISVIALIVVALVTYERTKYRKAFRKNRLREQAAPMGYGGMAQRDP